MTKYEISDEDKALIAKFVDISKRGYYADSKQVTEVYNRVLGKRVAVTNCGQCIKGRIRELEKALSENKGLSGNEKDEADRQSADAEKTPQKPRKQPKNAVRQKALPAEEER